MSVSPSDNPFYPSLIGRRFSKAGTFYLAEDQGVRGISDPATYNRLFRDWNGVEALDGSAANAQDVQAFNQAPVGPPIADGMMLAKDPNAPEVYLIDQGWKRPIVSPAVMDKYHFSWQAIQAMSGSALAALPNGDPITGTVSIYLMDPLHALNIVHLWNHWRAGYPGVIILLGGANLSGAFLIEANLGGAKLNEANLSMANLSRANLSGVDLTGANLYQADLSNANLSNANLTAAFLSGANLTGADLTGATMPDGTKHH